MLPEPNSARRIRAGCSGIEMRQERADEGSSAHISSGEGVNVPPEGDKPG